jgi:predicted secreted Zn-dependent protease
MSVVALMLFLSEVPAEPATVSETFEYYEVTGSTVAELRASLDGNGPRKSRSGRPSAGFTQWNVEWSYLWTTTSDECRLTRVSTTLTVATTLPRWARPTVRWSSRRAGTGSWKRSVRTRTATRRTVVTRPA